MKGKTMLTLALIGIALITLAITIIDYIVHK